MSESIERHIKLMDNIRNTFGQANLMSILNCLQTQVKLEPNEDNKYLLNMEIDKYSLLVEREKMRMDESVLDTINNTTQAEDTTTEVEKNQYITLERDGMSYSVANNKKNRILHAALLSCLYRNKNISTLCIDDYREIGTICDINENSVKTQITRIVKDKKNGLSVKEKQYYVMFLANKGFVNIIESFPFLIYDPAFARRDRKFA